MRLPNLSRRSFLATAGALSSQLLRAQNEGRKIGYCIVGLGRISMQHFMPGVKISEHCRITGLEPAFPYTGLRFTAKIQGEPPIDEPTNDPEPNQFKREADHFAECILNNRESRASGEEGLKDMKIMMAIYRSCGR